jgi:hypothetical protein
MRLLKFIFDFFFGCGHRHTTWPHRHPRGFHYVCCLDCGKELPYSVLRMRIISRDEQLEEEEDIGASRASRDTQGNSANSAQPGKILAFPERVAGLHLPASKAIIRP